MKLRLRRCGRIAALFAVVLMVPAFRGEACSCPAERSPGEAMRRASAVFEGTIVDQRAVLITVDDPTTAAIDYEVRLTRIWKGPSSQTVHLLRRCLCDPAFRVGTSYLIYAAGDRLRGLVVVACTPTKLAADAALDVVELGAPLAVFERTSTVLPPSMPYRRRVRAYVVAGLAVYASVFSEWRDALSSVEAAWLTAVMLQVCVGLVYLKRRRLKLGAALLGGAAAIALCAVIWSGQRLLDNEWFSPLLMWSIVENLR